MGMNLLEKLQSKIELYRLEQRYMRRKHRTTFPGDVHYVNGEYVYANSAQTSPTSTTSPSISKQSTGSYWRPSGWSRSHSSDLRC
ncbi:hypothetical protein V8E54_002662 [Elaphomyces granulatus]